MNILIKDIKVNYEIIGSGIPILMIHGWGPDHRMLEGCMEPLFNDFDTQFKRIYFDLPGMGLTNGSGWINSTDKMLELVMLFIDAIIPNEEYVLIGKSYGGYLARGLVKNHSHRIKGLFLLCPLAKKETQGENAPLFTVLEKDPSLDELLTDEEKGFFESINVIQTKAVWRRFKEYILPGLKIADNNFLDSCLGKAVPYQEPVDDPTKRYDFPTLMLTGRQDSCVGYSDLWEILEIYPRATFAVINGAGHNLEIEQLDIFHTLVKEWLERIMKSPYPNE